MSNGSHTAVTDRALTHQALLYSSEDEFLHAAVPFVEAGLARGEQVLAVTSKTNIGLLRGALGSHARQVEFANAGDWYQAPSWTLRAYGHYVDEYRYRHPRVRVLGEPVWNGRSELEITELARYESLLNVAFANIPVSILCPYDTRHLDPEILAAARHTHPELATPEGTQTSPNYLDPVAYTAECDSDPLDEPASTLAEHQVTRDSLPGIRRLTQRTGLRLGLSPDRSEDLTIAANEVAGNAIQHGGGSGQLRLWHEDHTLVCEVTNQEGRIDEPFPGHLPPDSTPSSRGLWMVRQLCELVQIRSHQGGGCTVRLHVYLD